MNVHSKIIKPISLFIILLLNDGFFQVFSVFQKNLCLLCFPVITVCAKFRITLNIILKYLEYVRIQFDRIYHSVILLPTAKFNKIDYIFLPPPYIIGKSVVWCRVLANNSVTLCHY